MTKLRQQNWVWSLRPLFAISLLVLLAVFYGGQPASKGAGREKVRLACFPNVTHAAGLAGIARGDFQQALGPDITLETKLFTAGPEEMEALLAGAIDVAYVGPGPAINTYLKSKGRALRILAGACSGGASLVARAGVRITSVRDLDGKRVAVPQLGSTQDISLRHFLAQENLQVQEKGGTVQVLPIKPADTLTLFKQGQLDAAWMQEPWATRLVEEAKAQRIADERDLWPEHRFSTTVLVVRTDFLAKHPQQIEALLQAHLNSLTWLRQNRSEAQSLINSELKRLTGKALPTTVLTEAWSRVEFTSDPIPASVQAFARMATTAGYLRDGANITALLDMRPLDKLQKSVTLRPK